MPDPNPALAAQWFDEVDVGEHYRRSRERLVEVFRRAGPGSGSAQVAACPGWRAHDVLAHLVGVIEDGAAGRIRGIPDAAQTDEQVRRHRADDTDELIAHWERVAGPFERALTERAIWPAMLDALSHEHDVRTALDAPGGRDIDSVRFAARRVVEGLDIPATVVVRFPDGNSVSSVARPDEPTYVVATTPFEVFRFRLGRRSRDQVLALDWTPDPTPILDRLFVFGPAFQPLLE